MKKLWLHHRFTLLGGLLGLLLGYLYWYYWGCEEGCTIRSVWWRMSLWGALMGGLLFSAFADWWQARRQH